MILKESVVTTKGEKCAMFKQDCPTENLGLPHLDYLLLLIDRQRLTKASFLSIRNCLKRSLDDEIKHVRELLLSTIKSHSEESTEHFQINWKRQLSKIQRRVKEDPVFLGIIPCSLWNQKGTPIFVSLLQTISGFGVGRLGSSKICYQKNTSTLFGEDGQSVKQF